MLNSQNEDFKNEGTQFTPSFEAVCEFFDNIIDTMVGAVDGLPHVEQLLFQLQENLQV